MPRIPIIQEQVGVPAVRFQNVPNQEAVGAFETIQAVGERIQEASDRTEIAKLINEGRAKFDETIKINSLEIVDPDEYNSRTASQIAKLKEQAVGSASNGRVRRYVEQALNSDLIRTNTELKIETHRKKIDTATANLAATEKALMPRLASQDSVKRQEASEEYGTLVGGLIADGLLGRAAAQKRMETIHGEANWQRANLKMEADPGGFLNDLAAGKYDEIDADKRLQLERFAKEMQSRQRTEQKLIEQERVDKINKDLLIKMETGSLKLRDILNLDVPFEVQRFWVDRLEHRRKSGEDPFRKSDGATMGRVFKGILEEPEKWSVTDITQYIGKGLSVHDATQAVGMWERAAAKADKAPSELDPLKQTLKTWERLRAQAAFLPQDERDKDKLRERPELTAKNDTEAQKVWNEVIRREAGGENPQNVLNELMQPYYEEKVKGWGDWLSGLLGAPAPDRQEVIEARQYLSRNGAQLTEQNIQAAIQYLKKKKLQRLPASQREY